MSERYTKVFELSKNMYAENAPVVISAGALFKDNQTGTILAQLKIRNITNKVIKAAKVSILPFDTVGKQIGDEIKHEYLDLFVGRDFEFGQKVPITLPNNSTRSFSVTVNEIIFTDNSIWNYSGEEWSALREAQWLSFVLRGAEMVKQFKIEYGEDCEFEAVEDRDVWICSCGKINKKDESKCFYCGCSLLSLNNVDLSKLNEDRDKRVAEEIEQAKQIQAKRMKKSILAAAICILVVILFVVSVDYNKKYNIYEEAITLANSDSVEEFNNGISMLEELDGFRDSEYQKNSAIYHRALILKSQNPSEAIRLFTVLGDFEDSSKKKDEILNERYSAGVECFNNEKYLQAYENFVCLGDYKDSKEKAEEAKIIYYINGIYDSNYKKCVDMLFDDEENYERLYGDELKKALIGTWIRADDDSSFRRKYLYTEDGTEKFNMSSEYVRYWVIENDCYKEANGIPNYYQVRKVNDDILILYIDTSLTKVISGGDVIRIYVRENSVWANKYISEDTLWENQQKEG